MKKIQSIIVNIVLMICVVLLSGCSKSHVVPKEVVTTEEMESGEEACLEESPLIYAKNPQEENMADLLQKTAAKMMVQIQTGNVIGSGVIWEIAGDRLVIATVGHVLTMGNGEVQVVFADGWAAPIAEYRLTNTDLAFLYIDLQEIPREHLMQYYQVNIDAEGMGQLQNGDGIITMGSSTGVAADAYEGVVMEPWIYVEDFANYMILVRCEVEPGMSGGGLFDYEGHFLGILCGANEDGEAVAIPFSIINSLYRAF